MPKKINKVIYNGDAEELRIDFGDKNLVLKKGIVTTIKDEQIYQHLISGKKKMDILDVKGVEDNHARKMKERLLKEG